MKTIYFMTVLLAIAFVAVRGARIARDAEEEEKKEPTLAEKLAEEASQLVKELEELHQKLISSGDRVSALQVGSAEHRLAAILDKVDWLILLQPDNVPSKFTTALQNAINAAKNTIAENSVAATEAATEAVVEVETVAPVEVVPVVTEAPARKFRSVHARIARDAEEEEKKEPTLAEQLAEEASQLVKELDELRHKLIASGDRASAREVSEAQDRLEQKLDNVDWLIRLQPNNVPSKFIKALQNAISAAKNTIAENSVAATEAAVVEVETSAPVEVVPVVTETPARRFRSVRDAEEEEKKEPTLAEQLAEEARQLVKELDELRQKLIASDDRASAREVSEAQDRLEQKLDNVDWLIRLQPNNVPRKFIKALQNAISDARTTIAENSVAATEAAVVEVETSAPEVIEVPATVAATVEALLF